MRRSLSPHPTTPPGPVRALDVEWGRDRLLLWVRFTVEADPARLSLPDPRPQGRADELWRRTCFEVFVRTADGYREYNLSPSGQWASYAFDGYRHGMREADEVATVLGVDGAENQLALEARLELPLDAVGPLALSAVIEDADGQIAYWAAAHPAPRPDFHHPDAFVLDLPPSEPA